MTTFFLAYAGLPRFAFLRIAFQLESLHTLRVGKHTYAHVLEQLTSLSKARRSFADIVFPRDMNALLRDAFARLQQEPVPPAPEDIIILLNLGMYPLDIPWLDHLLAKACDTSVPLRVEAEAGNGEQTEAAIAAVCLRCSCLAAGTADAGEWGVVHADARHMADLSHPPTVLRLFSSNFSLRHFNSLLISRKIYFLKMSDKRDKMRAEHAFLSQLPSAVRPYFPHVGDLCEEGERAGYEVEIVPQLDVAKSLFNGMFAHEEHCRALLDGIGRYLEACPRQTVSRDAYLARARNVFVEKTRARAELARQLPQFATLDRICRLQGRVSFASFMQEALALLEETIAEDASDTLVFSHGNLFFANMLFDPAKGTLKLVDPRGLRDGDIRTGYLPAWYDLAKLSHSILGHYDLMVYDMMDIVMRPDLRLGLRSENIPGLGTLAKYFRRMLDSRQIPESRLRIYEGSLFLSMIPLHADDPLRMTRQLLRAMELLPPRA